MPEQIRSKETEFRAAYRRRQRRLQALAAAPGLLFGTGIVLSWTSRGLVGTDIAIAIGIPFYLIALILWLIYSQLKSDPTAIQFQSHFTGKGTCPDCGSTDLNYSQDDKKLKRKNFVAWLVAIVFPFLPIVNFILLASIDSQGEKINDLYSFLPLLLIFSIPFVIALDRMNNPRIATCKKCGYSDTVGLDREQGCQCLAVHFIEQFWMPCFNWRWLIMIGLIAISFLAPFAFSEPADVFIIFFGFVLVALIFLFFVAPCNVKFYEGYYEQESEQEKPKAEHPEGSKAAIES